MLDYYQNEFDLCLKTIYTDVSFFDKIENLDTMYDSYLLSILNLLIDASNEIRKKMISIINVRNLINIQKSEMMNICDYLNKRIDRLNEIIAGEPFDKTELLFDEASIKEYQNIACIKIIFD